MWLNCVRDCLKDCQNCLLRNSACLLGMSNCLSSKILIVLTFYYYFFPVRFANCSLRNSWGFGSACGWWRLRRGWKVGEMWYNTVHPPKLPFFFSWGTELCRLEIAVIPAQLQLSTEGWQLYVLCCQMQASVLPLLLLAFLRILVKLPKWGASFPQKYPIFL